MINWRLAYKLTQFYNVRSLKVKKKQIKYPSRWFFGKQDLYLSKKRTLFCQHGYTALSSRKVMFALEKYLSVIKCLIALLVKEPPCHCCKYWVVTWSLCLALPMEHGSTLLCQFSEHQVPNCRARSERRKAHAAEKVAISLEIF